MIDDLVQERMLRKVEYWAGVNIDTAYIPTVQGKKQELKGPDKPHVGWDFTKKTLSYQQDGSEKVVSKATTVGHIILDNVSAFRPTKKEISTNALKGER